jgi:ATP-binding cassette, subfamily B, bacterial PglK
MFGFQKLWFMLNPKQRRAAILLLVCIICGTLLETLGVGLIVPWLDLLGNPSHEQLVVLAMLIFAGVYFVKVVFLIFLAWLQAHFVSWANADFSLRLFAGYLAQPYTFHLQRNSAVLIRNAMSQVSQVTSAIQAYMTIATESLLFLGLLILMLIVETTSALWVVSILGLASWGFYHFTKNCTKRWGEQLQTHEKLRLQYLREGLGAAKDVKVLGREKEFIGRYHASNIGSAQISKWKTVISSLPRFWLELLGVMGITAIVLILISQNRPMDSLIPTLGLFAVTAFRPMPSANRLLNAAQNVRFLFAAFDNLHREFCILDKVKPQQDYSPISFNNDLVLENVSYCYPSTEGLALKEVSL